MAHNPHLDPAAPPVAARAWVLQQLQALVPALRRATPAAQRLCARYVAGELSWAEMHRALDADAG